MSFTGVGVSPGFSHIWQRGASSEQREAVLLRAQTARQGNPAAMCDMGDAFQFGKVLKPYGPAAEKCYLSAIEKGHAVARVHLGRMYELGASGFPSNQEVARFAFAHALEEGNAQARRKIEKIANEGSDAALCALARDDAEKEAYESAFKRVSLAAKIHQKSSLPHFYLGMFYERGTGTEKDQAKACLHYYKSGLFGSENGGHALARLAEGGSIEASYYLGLLLTKIEASEQAFPHFYKAAHAGHKSACFELGKCYLHGIGVEENAETAEFWFARGPVEEDSYVEEGSPAKTFVSAEVCPQSGELPNGLKRE